MSLGREKILCTKGVPGAREIILELEPQWKEPARKARKVVAPAPKRKRTDAEILFGPRQEDEPFDFSKFLARWSTLRESASYIKACDEDNFSVEL